MPQALVGPDPLPVPDVAALVRSVEGMVRTVAKQFHRGLAQNDLEDLEAAGREGALCAAHRFDPDRGANFNTYATWWIRAYVIQQAMFFWGQGRLTANSSRTAKRVFYQYARARQEIEASGQEATVDRIAEAIGVTTETVLFVLPIRMRSDRSLDETHEDVTPLKDRIVDEGAVDPLSALCEGAESVALEEALSLLSDRERQVVEGHYLAEQTLDEVGARLGFSGEFARQVEIRAIAKLRRHFMRQGEFPSRK